MRLETQAKDDPTLITSDKYDEGDKLIRATVYYMRWGHFAEVVIPLATSAIKRRSHRQITSLILILSNLFGYLLPVMVLIYASCKYFQNMCYFDTPYSNWLYFEILFFVCWIFSTCVFLFLAYSCKLRSQQRHANNTENRDIWMEKDVSDFLYYISLEYRQVCLPLSFIFVDVFNWSSHTQ